MVLQVLFVLGFQRLTAVVMICGMRKRSWIKDTDVFDREQEQEPYLRLRRNRTMSTRNKDVTPWYLKLLCEERDGESEHQGSKARAADMSGSQDCPITDSDALPLGNTDGSSPKSKPSNGDVKPRSQTLDYVLAKKLKASKKSLQHHRTYNQPYSTDSDLIKKYKHAGAVAHSDTPV